MHQSHTYASRGTKTAFVEIAQRRAQIDRLQREVGGTQPRRLTERALSVVGWAQSRYDGVVHGLGNRVSKMWAEARG